MADPTDDGPPLEAYSRVTDPERFAPLHPRAEELLDRLADEYEVRREEGSDLAPDIARVEFVRPTVRLTPIDSGGAPLRVSFTAFPGLIVRAGRWHDAAFPACGCDACGEGLEATWRSFERLVRAVVDGGFSERIEVSGGGERGVGPEWRAWRPR